MQGNFPQHQLQSKGLLRWADAPKNDRNFPRAALHSLVRILLIIYKEFRKNDLPLRSAALTYTILLSLVPILAMSTAVVKGLGGGNQLREVAYTYIDTLDQSSSFHIPGSEPNDPSAQAADQDPQSSGLTVHLRDAADKLFDYVDKTNFATLGSFGVAGILLSVILVFGNIELALNAIWKIKDSRSITRKIADYLTLIFLLPISINIAFAASAFLANPTLAAKFQMIFPFIWLQTIILKLIPVFFIAITFYVIYIFFPNTKVHTVPALTGAVLAAIFWFAVQNVYISLQVGVSNYNAIYGSFATLPLFLVWMYLGWLFVLGGAQVAYACQHLSTYRLIHENSEPSRRLSTALDIMDSIHRAFNSNTPITMQELIEQQPSYSPTLVRDVAERLIASEVLHLSTTHAQLLPAAPASTVMNKTIVGIILGASTPDTPGGKASKEAIQAAAAQSGSFPSGLSGAGSASDSGSGSLQDGPSST